MEEARAIALELLQSYDLNTAHADNFVFFSEKEIDQIHELVTTAQPMFKAIPTNQEGLNHE